MPGGFRAPPPSPVLNVELKSSVRRNSGSVDGSERSFEVFFLTEIRNT